MAITTARVRMAGLDEAVGALRSWQFEGSAPQLHPGDVGWLWRFGAEKVADSLRVWRRDGDIVAVGILDGADLVRLTMAPDVLGDEALARQLVTDLNEPGQGLLGAGTAFVEAPAGALMRGLLAEAGWHDDDPWTWLRRDLSSPVPEPEIRVEVVGPELAPERVDVQRAAFDRSTFTLERWQAMAAGPSYAEARCLLGRDDRGAAVAAVTVWSAGPGRPGLIEPMGVHSGHRRHGYGREITVAAAAALRDLGASSVVVGTPSSNVAGVATYRSAGMVPQPEIRDLRRDPR